MDYLHINGCWLLKRVRLEYVSLIWQEEKTSETGLLHVKNSIFLKHQ